MAYRSHVVHDNVSALHINAWDVGHNPVQVVAELGVVWAGRIRVHLQREERSAQASTPCACPWLLSQQCALNPQGRFLAKAQSFCRDRDPALLST